MMSQQLVQVMAWYRRTQAITRANVDPDLFHHMASLGHNKLGIHGFEIKLGLYLKLTDKIIKH